MFSIVFYLINLLIKKNCCILNKSFLLVEKFVEKIFWFYLPFVKKIGFIRKIITPTITNLTILII